GLLLLDAWGIGRFLLVQTDEDLRAHYEIAADLGAPPSLLEALRGGEALPWFPSRDGFYHKSLENPEASLYPSTAISGEQWYYYALIDHVERFRLQHVKSYRSWLREQDLNASISHAPKLI
ncbi:MAG TPA: hypothetical protein VK519_15585, partial [Pinirhizobacter sp.]